MNKDDLLRIALYKDIEDTEAEVSKKWDKSDLRIAGQNLLNGTSADWKTINNNGVNGNGNYLLDSRIYFKADEDYVFRAVLKPQTFPVRVRAIRYRKDGSISYDPITQIVQVGEVKQVTLRVENRTEEYEAFQLQLMNIRDGESADEYKVDIKEMKLEEGSVATGWTPSLKDNNGEYSQSSSLINREHLNYIKKSIRDVNNNLREDSSKPLKVQIADEEPPAEDGRIYYNTKDELFYISKDGQWYRFFVEGDEKLEQDAPVEPPKVEKITDTTVTLATGDNMQFRYQGGSWQESNYFAGLQRNETYYFEQRYASGDIHKASEPSPSLKVITKKGTQSIPNRPDISNLEHDRVTVKGESDTEVSLDKVSWYSSPHTFTNLDEKTEYNAYARRRETNTHYASEPSISVNFTTPAKAWLCGFEIDESNANPETAVKYIGDSIGRKPMKISDYGDWEELVKDISKPVLLKNGEVQYELQYNDFTKKKDGTSSILTGEDGDVMIQFKHLWIKEEVVSEDIRRVWISDVEIDGSVSYSKITEKGYNQLSYGLLLTLQHLYLLLYKNRDSRMALGVGADKNSDSSRTGATNTRPYFFGEDKRGEPVKFCGIENMWGGQGQFIDGIVTDNISRLKIGYSRFSDNGLWYDNTNISIPDSIGEYISKTQGGDLGYIVLESKGSSSTYYCDMYRSSPSGVYTTESYGSGIFFFNFMLDADYKSIYYSSRLCFVDDNYFYVGAYMGYADGGKLRSISGFEPTGYKSIGEFRKLAQANN